MENTLTIGLFDPGMSHLHRVGLAGLYMALKHFTEPGITFRDATWRLSNDKVELVWNGNARDFFKPLFEASFGIQDGLIDFAAHRGHPMGDLERIALSEAVRMTFLQHCQQNKIPKGTPDRVRNFDFDDKVVAVSYKPFVKPYAHVTAHRMFLDSRGNVKDCIAIKGWLCPGAAERHSNLSGTEIEEPPSRFLCLLFAPMACLVYRLSHTGPDGKRDSRRGNAIVFPHIQDMQSYARSYQRYLESPIERLSADSVGDAGFSALLTLKAGETLDRLGVTGCTVVTMGSVGWVSNQRSRTRVSVLDRFDEKQLRIVEFAWRCLPNRKIVVKQKPTKQNPNPANAFFIGTSLARGAIAENIGRGHDWFHDFATLMSSSKQAKKVSFEEGGLAQMVEDQEVMPEGPDRIFVLACHEAWRRRMGELGEKARREGSSFTDQVKREFTRLRVAFSRCKNAVALREAVTAFWARSGPIKPLQEAWHDVLPLFQERSWRKARDLALLALASYKAKTKEEADALEKLESTEVEGEQES